jgi:acyl-CoA synthetase (AMP-forming)/AMP-acid ligase II
MNLVNLLDHQARQRGEEPALIDRHRGTRRSVCFRELAEDTARGADLFLDSGLRPGDVVLFVHPVSIELYTGLLAVLRGGMRAMFVDPSAGTQHIARCCRMLPPQAFFGSPKAHLLRLLSPAVRRIYRHFHTGSLPLPGSKPWKLTEDLATDHPTQVLSTTPALITFTSGSTGQPKAAVRSHGFLLAQHEVLREALAHVPGEIELVTLPVFVLSSLASGITCVLADTDLAKPGDADVPAVAAQIRDERITRVAASPAFLECLVREKADLSSLKKIYTGGAPVFPRLLEDLARLAPGAHVDAVYGSTEAEPIAHCPHSEMTPDDLTAMRNGRGLLAGRPSPAIRLRVISDQWGREIAALDEAAFESLQCPPGTPGEIVVSGDHVLKGYLDGQGDRETKFKVEGETWHRTGDAGFLADDGRLWLLGRCGATLRDARGTVFPFAVECALSFEPALGRCAVVAHQGERLLIRERGHPHPLDPTRFDLDRVVEVDKIPLDRRHNAKIDYPALTALLERESRV